MARYNNECRTIKLENLSGEEAKNVLARIVIEMENEVDNLTAQIAEYKKGGHFNLIRGVARERQTIDDVLLCVDKALDHVDASKGDFGG